MVWGNAPFAPCGSPPLSVRTNGCQRTVFATSWAQSWTRVNRPRRRRSVPSFSPATAYPEAIIGSLWTRPRPPSHGDARCSTVKNRLSSMGVLNCGTGEPVATRSTRVSTERGRCTRSSVRARSEHRRRRIVCIRNRRFAITVNGFTVRSAVLSSAIVVIRFAARNYDGKRFDHHRDTSG